VIFVTVGTDGPFDRLVRAVDEWAGEVGRTDVFAQVGRSTFRPNHVKSIPFLKPAEFERCVRSARAVVSHAGTGTILTALLHGKPVLVMPRLAALRERRDDHQLATARHLSVQGRVGVAFNEDELRSCLERIDQWPARACIGPYAQPTLIAAVREFIDRRSRRRP